MTQEKDSMPDAAERILEAVMFESWLRFSFLEEVSGEGPDDAPRLLIRLDEAARQRLAERESHLLPLARLVDGREASFENSREAVCRFVLEELEGKSIAQGTAVTPDITAGILQVTAGKDELDRIQGILL